MDEEILVVARKELFGQNDERHFSGFLSAEKGKKFIEIIEKKLEFKARGPMETDASYQQIIPYIIFKHKKKVFVYQRLRAGGEQRLHNLHSIGVGGHINKQDHGNGNVLIDALRREFEEEIIYGNSYEPKLLGFINDDSNDVGKVHFGVVYLIEGDSDAIAVRETDTLEGKLMDKGEIEAIAQGFESWSKLAWQWVKKKI